MPKSWKDYPSNQPEVMRVRVRDWYKKARIEALKHYRGEIPSCACCGETIIEFLTLDHINGDGYKTKKKLGRYTASGKGLYIWAKKHNYPPVLQVLCYNCNCSKRNEKECPHKKYDR